jgi:hypothetical protein
MHTDLRADRPLSSSEILPARSSCRPPFQPIARSHISSPTSSANPPLPGPSAAASQSLATSASTAQIRRTAVLLAGTGGFAGAGVEAAKEEEEEDEEDAGSGGEADEDDEEDGDGPPAMPSTLGSTIDNDHMNAGLSLSDLVILASLACSTSNRPITVWTAGPARTTVPKRV